MANPLKTAALFAMGFGFAGSLARAEGMYHGYETPNYQVLARYGEAELRAYDPYIVAQVTVPGDRREALNAGFRLLAGYIFGGNQQDQKVAMTVPVMQEPAGASLSTQETQDGLWTVTFTMPGAYTLDSLPEPQSDAVRFAQVAAEQRLVLTFSGRNTDAAITEETAKLQAIADAAGLTLSGPVITQFYDDPMTLPWNRRNEVAFRLAV